MEFSPQQANEHNRFVDEAAKLIRGEIHLDGVSLPSPGWFTRRRLKKAKALYEQAIAINAAGWQSMLWIAKIEQRLGHTREALTWILRAREFEPSNPILAKEAAMTASQLGDQDMAARIADEALAIAPGDAALHVNSGLAHLFAGRNQYALERFREAVRLEPDRRVNHQLESFVAQVISGSVPQPRAEKDIARWLQNA
jgi:tetratricopeptide (TPR) repeat protein